MRSLFFTLTALRAIYRNVMVKNLAYACLHYEVLNV